MMLIAIEAGAPVSRRTPHTVRLLGRSEQENTQKVYRRIGETVKPTK